VEQKLRWYERLPGITNDESHIRGFFEEYRWLSNFHICDVEYEGLVYGSTEAAYQAAKTLDQGQKKVFQDVSPAGAKKLGSKIDIRPDWEDIKIQVMYDINLDKYTKHKDLRDKLLATGDMHLEETNWWGDRFWGVCKGTGRNELGKVLMQVREKVKTIDNEQLGESLLKNEGESTN
jgi:ribA/ribD-fused uncharacterized protein